MGAPVASRRYERGTVAEMSPGPGSAEPGDTIMLRVSKGARRGDAAAVRPGGGGGGGGGQQPPTPPGTATPRPENPAEQAPA